MKKKKNKKEQSLKKKYTVEEARNFADRCVNETLDSKIALKNFADKWMGKGEDFKKKNIDQMAKDITALSIIFGVENGHALVNCVSGEFRKLAVEMKHNMEKEFDCKTYSEKALVDLAVNAYLKNVYYSNRMLTNQEDARNNHNNYRKYLSKEIDRSQRQYISAIETLKYFKQPSFNLNVKTNTAFFADKQQINNNRENNEAK